MKLISIVFFIGALALLNTGCSLVGLAIGANSDSKKPPYTYISYPKTQAVKQQARPIAAELKPGREIIVTTRDSSQIAGKYLGTEGSQENPAIKISNKGAWVSVPISAISEIRIKNSRNGALTGFLKGAVVDGAVIVMIIEARKSFKNAWTHPLGEGGL